MYTNQLRYPYFFHQHMCRTDDDDEDDDVNGGSGEMKMKGSSGYIMLQIYIIKAKSTGPLLGVPGIRNMMENEIN